MQATRTGRRQVTYQSSNRNMLYLRSVLISLLFSCAVAACALISHYDPTSYQHATDLKAQSLLLISKATDPPGVHAAEIADLHLKLQQAYEYERGKGKPNVITVQQWQILNDPERNLLGGFLKTWQTENIGQPSEFINGVSKNVGSAFDQIIKLESSKVKN